MKSRPGNSGWLSIHDHSQQLFSYPGHRTISWLFVKNKSSDQCVAWPPGLLARQHSVHVRENQIFRLGREIAADIFTSILIFCMLNPKVLPDNDRRHFYTEQEGSKIEERAIYYVVPRDNQTGVNIGHRLH